MVGYCVKVLSIPSGFSRLRVTPAAPCDPRSPHMQATMNLKIKFRESFRPFAPCVLQEHASSWFDMEPGQEGPYMLLVAPVLDCHRVSVLPEELALMHNDPDLRKRVNVV